MPIIVTQRSSSIIHVIQGQKIIQKLELSKAHTPCAAYIVLHLEMLRVVDDLYPHIAFGCTDLQGQLTSTRS